MDDVRHAFTLFLIFAVALLLYSALLVVTGDLRYLPLRAQHSIGSEEDVRRVGRITGAIALAIGTISTVVVLVRVLG